MKKPINKKNLLYFILLLIFPPMVIEMLTGSTPPVNYFTPLVLIIFAIVYGLVVVLIREMKIRWNLTWQFIFLFPIMGILIEGIFMQSFFNIYHEDLNELSNVGVFLGVQWPWTIYLCLAHGLLAVALPLYMVDILIPSMRKTTLLTRRGIIISLALIALVTIIQLLGINNGDNPMYRYYSVTFLGTVGCIAVIGSLIYLAYRFKDIKLEKRDYKKHKFMGIIAFACTFAFLMATHLVVQTSPAATILLQILLTLVFIAFSYRYIYLSKRQLEDLLPLLNGTILIYIVFALFQGFGMMDNPDPTAGMEIVGIAFAVLVAVVNVVGIRRKANIR